jgi:hypothetical protein
MNKIRWYVYRSMDQLPILTVLAWLGLIAVIVLTVLLWLPSQQQIVRTDLPGSVPKTIHMPTLKMTQLDTFFSAVPRVEQVSQSIETLFAVAVNYNISLQEVIYQDEIKSGEPILHYAIDFTVQNSYPNIKAFLTALLVAIPYLALEQISFERDDIEASQIQTNFKFKLYLDHE